MIQKVLQAKTMEDLPLLIQWMDFLKWLLQITEKFPKRVRFTFSDRINSIALNIVEDLVEARYSRTKIQSLRRVNLSLEKLRVLLRIAYECQILPHVSYEYAMTGLNQVGKNLGGWLKQQGRHAAPEQSI